MFGDHGVMVRARKLRAAIGNEEMTIRVFVLEMFVRGSFIC